MKEVTADVRFSFGMDCRGCGYGTASDFNYEISDELEEFILEKTDGDVTVSGEKLETIADETGNLELLDLIDQIKADAHIVDIEYWLENTYDEGGSLRESFNKDLDSGEFVPSISLEAYVEQQGGNNSSDEKAVEDYEEEYDVMVFEEYSEYVDSLEVYTRAEKHGLDTSACWDDDMEYWIEIN